MKLDEIADILGVINLILNLIQTSNDTLRDELHKQNTEYLTKIEDKLDLIIDKLNKTI
jgi:hypothetical protein